MPWVIHITLSPLSPPRLLIPYSKWMYHEKTCLHHANQTFCLAKIWWNFFACGEKLLWSSEKYIWTKYTCFFIYWNVASLFIKTGWGCLNQNITMILYKKYTYIFWYLLKCIEKYLDFGIYHALSLYNVSWMQNDFFLSISGSRLQCIFQKFLTLLKISNNCKYIYKSSRRKP